VNALSVNLAAVTGKVGEANRAMQNDRIAQAGANQTDDKQVLPQKSWDSQAHNRYAYSYNNPLKHTDPGGHVAFLVPVVTGLIGGVAGAAGTFIAEVASGQGSFAERVETVDWGNVAIGAGVGAVAGAAAPFVATSAIGGAILGGCANGAQYALTQWSNSDVIQVENLAVNVGVGMVVGGAIDGAIPKIDTSRNLLFAVDSPWLDPSLARSINRGLELAPLVTSDNLVRSGASGVAGNLPVDTWILENR
jgi:hypothetical protein